MHLKYQPEEYQGRLTLPVILQCRVLGFGFGVQGLGCRVLGLSRGAVPSPYDAMIHAFVLPQMISKLQKLKP